MDKSKVRGISNEKNCGPGKRGKEKVFIPRESVITNLRQVPDINIIYRTFIVALFVFYIRFVFDEYINSDNVTFGTKYILLGFNNMKIVIYLWIFMFGLTLLVFPFFKFWSGVAKQLVIKKFIQKLWNILWVFASLVYVGLIFYVPFKFEAFSEAMAANLIILFEQVRFFMKFHAFLSHNCSRTMGFKPHSDEIETEPTFSNYVYFLFAPTLIYRDDYPRTEKTDWSRVFVLSLEFVGCMFWASFLLHATSERYKNFGLVKETVASLVLGVIDMALIGPFFWLTGFYILLHVWLNIWSELLKFADRRFYDDWWNSIDFSTYYRKWNMVIHEYLHEYFYKSLLSMSNSKSFATFITFTISIIVHEYIIGFAFGFFFPMLGIHFAISAFLVKFKKPTVFNYFFIFAIAVGTAIEMSTYTMEYYARKNCPIEDETLWKYFYIRSLTCNGLNLN